MNDLNFIAITFEIATGKHSSICEVGICVVRDGSIVETKSWLVQPEDNTYSYWNIQAHGICPEDTANSPLFPEVWSQIEREYLGEFKTIVAHNMSYERSCLEYSAELYHINLPDLNWISTLEKARQIYSLSCSSIGFICDHLGIPEGLHHGAGNRAEMCARLFMRETADLRLSLS